MLTTDYEVEYDNRARVPEHPEIFARWQREGAAYRAAGAQCPDCLWFLAATDRRSVSRQGRRQGAIRDVHSWRLVAIA